VEIIFGFSPQRRRELKLKKMDETNFIAYEIQMQSDLCAFVVDNNRMGQINVRLTFSFHRRGAEKKD
jgi:hypothetical protein